MNILTKSLRKKSIKEVLKDFIKFLRYVFYLLFIKSFNIDSEGDKNNLKRSILIHALIVLSCVLLLPLSILLSFVPFLFIAVMGLYVYSGYRFLTVLPEKNLLSVALLARILTGLLVLSIPFFLVLDDRSISFAYVVNVPSVYTIVLLYDFFGMGFLGYSTPMLLLISFAASLLPSALMYLGLRLKMWRNGKAEESVKTSGKTLIAASTEERRYLSLKQRDTLRSLVTGLTSVSLVAAGLISFVYIFISFLWIQPHIPAVITYRNLPVFAASYERDMREVLLRTYGGGGDDWKMLNYGYGLSGSTYASPSFGSRWKHVPTGVEAGTSRSPFEYPIDIPPYFDEPFYNRLVDTEHGHVGSIVRTVSDLIPNDDLSVKFHDRDLGSAVSELFVGINDLKVPTAEMGIGLTITIETSEFGEGDLELLIERAAGIIEKLLAGETEMGKYSGLVVVSIFDRSLKVDDGTGFPGFSLSWSDNRNAHHREKALWIAINTDDVTLFGEIDNFNEIDILIDDVMSRLQGF